MGLRNRELFSEKRCFFITTTCYKWLHLIEKANAYSIIANSLNYLNKKYKATILGYVIMPNHLHMILYFVEQNHLSDYMRDFKKYTATQIRNLISKYDHALLNTIRYELKSQKFKIWEDRFDDLFLDTRKVIATKLDYIHNNPLQEHWQLAALPEEYAYSSAAYYYNQKEGVVDVTNFAEYFY